MDLATAAFLAALSVTPDAYKPTGLSQRLIAYESIATDIGAAVAQMSGELPFDGPAASEATVYALVAISAEESSFDPKVRDCRRKGDGGKSISVFQLYRGPGRGGHSEKEICEDPVLAARLAINILDWYRGEYSSQRIFNGYATGVANIGNYASSVQDGSFRRLLRENKITLTKKGVGRLYAQADEAAVAVLP